MNFAERKKKITSIALGISGLLVVSLYFLGKPPALPSLSWTGSEQTTPLLQSGTEAPGFSLSTAKGDEVQLADFQGQEVGLVFVTAACPYCNKLEEQLKTVSLPPRKQLLIICRGGETDAQKIEKAHALNFPVLIDSAGVIHQMYQVSGVPLVYLIDELGKVKSGTTGMPGAWEMIEQLYGKSGV